MDYIAKSFEALGKAIIDNELEIGSLKWERNSLRRRIEELEKQISVLAEDGDEKRN